MYLVIQQLQSVIEVAMLLFHFGNVNGTTNVLRQSPVLLVLPRSILDVGSLTGVVRIIVMFFMQTSFWTFRVVSVTPTLFRCLFFLLQYLLFFLFLVQTIALTDFLIFKKNLGKYIITLDFKFLSIGCHQTHLHADLSHFILMSHRLVSNGFFCTHLKIWI